MREEVKKKEREQHRLRRSSRVFMNARLRRKQATLDRRALIPGERIDVFFQVARSIDTSLLLGI